MKDESIQRYWQLVGEALQNPHALAWFQQFSEYVLAWDHVADGDPIDARRSDGAFQAVLLEWPVNPWWRAYGAALQPTLAAAVCAWRSSSFKDIFKIKGWDVYTEPLAAALTLMYGVSYAQSRMTGIRQAASALFVEHENFKGIINQG